MLKDKLNILLLSIITLLLVVIAVLIYFGFINKSLQNDNPPKNDNVTSFNDCILLTDSVIMESYPRQCRTTTGKTFVEEIRIDEKEEEKVSEVNIDVYMFDFKKFNIPDNIDYLTKVIRKTTRKDVATFAIEEIIKGPSSTELTKELKPTFGKGYQMWFVSESNCNGRDFKIEINNKIAKVQFCKDSMLAGDMSGFIITEQISKTLKQFSTIEKVQILNSKGYCLDDMSGQLAKDCIK